MYEDKQFYDYRQILEGLEFYYNKINELYPFISSEKHYVLKRDEIEMTLSYLKSIKSENPIKEIFQSHPMLDALFEEKKQFDTFNKHKGQMCIFIEHLTNGGIILMIQDAKYKIEEEIRKIELRDKVIYLINVKYFYKQKTNSFPNYFIDEMTKFLNHEIEKNKELQLNDLKYSGQKEEVCVEMNQKITNWLEMLSKAKLGKVISEIKEIAIAKDNDQLIKNIVNLSRRWNDLKEETRNDLITKEQEKTEKSKITSSLIEVVNIMKNENKVRRK